MSAIATWQDVVDGRARWCVVEGDCLEVLPMLPAQAVDHAISDPPYSRDLYLKFRSNRRGGSSRHWGASAHRDAKAPTPAFLALANEQIGAADDVALSVAAEFVRLVRRWMVVFHDAESGHLWREQFGDLHVRCGVWVKTNPMPQISGDRPGQGFESVEIAHAPGRKRWNGGGLPAVWTYGALQGNWGERAGNDHPCPKPVELMLEMTEQFTDPNELVLDPFAGSGTTGVACLRLGRRCILIEKSPKYAALARERMEAESQGLTLRDARAGQIPLFSSG